MKLQTSFFLSFFEQSPPYNSQRTDANTDATNNTTHTNTYSHITHFQHRYRPTSLQVARGLHSHTRTVVSCVMRTCSPDSEPRYMHSGPKGKSEPCVHRESPTGRVIIVIVAEREEREDKREREREKAENPSVCRFKTSPCVPGKRPHVLDMRAFSRYTRRRLERTHGGILNLHTEGVFRMPSRTTPDKTTHTTPHHTMHVSDN